MSLARAVSTIVIGVCLAASCSGDDSGTVTPPVPVDTTVTPTGSGARCEDGKARDYPCARVDLVSRLRKDQIGAEEGLVNDIWGWHDRVTRTEWALVGHSGGTSFVNLKDPQFPVYTGILPLSAGATKSDWRDIKVYRDHAFIVADGAGEHGMQVFDLTELRSVAEPPVTLTATATYTRIHSAHNIVINEETGFAYSVGGNGGGDTCGGGLHMIDIRVPTDPQFEGCFADVTTGYQGTGYTHDAMCIVYRGPDTEHRGREVCFGSNQTGLSIADVTDKQEPFALTSVSYPAVGYSHQGWIDEAHEYFYMNDEFDEFASQGATRTLVWDVRDLDDPVVVKEFLSETRATDHNLYVVGDLMYQSNYRVGLRILNIADRENPREIAFFDTEPNGGDVPGTNGSWSNYPFFTSGLIAVTSMDEGVFFVRRTGGS